MQKTITAIFQTYSESSKRRQKGVTKMTDDMIQASIEYQKAIKEAERLANIEVLEEIRREMFNKNNDYEDMMLYTARMIATLKAGN